MQEPGEANEAMRSKPRLARSIGAADSSSSSLRARHTRPPSCIRRCALGPTMTRKRVQPVKPLSIMHLRQLHATAQSALTAIPLKSASAAVIRCRSFHLSSAMRPPPFHTSLRGKCCRSLSHSLCAHDDTVPSLRGPHLGPLGGSWASRTRGAGGQAVGEALGEAGRIWKAMV
jgi:hypothetical protein